MKPLKSGYSFLISRKGVILAHPRKEMIMSETIFSIAASHNNPLLHDIGEKMVRGESGFTPYTDTNGTKSWMYYAPVTATGWTLAVVFPEAELFAEVRSLTLTVIGMGAVGLLLLAGGVALIARSITKPLHQLAAATEAVAAGNFDLELPPSRSQDEVGKLTKAFSAMNSALKQYITNLTETTAAKERIQSELKLATDIQASLLPRIFPPFPDRADIELYALMEPAKEVGGDFYDFFFLDDHRICLVIGDVSDKGVPAALYMMVAKTLLKSEALRDASPAEILERVNSILALDNESSMFVTVFCAILDTDNGALSCANAGHLPPVFLKPGEAAVYHRFNPGFVLGPMPGISYQTEQLTLQPGDLFLLYTDGVNEAVDPDKNEFGEQRLLDCVNKTGAGQPEAIIHAIRTEVLQFANGAPQSDDITMLAIRYLGKPQ
jgi:sigma-B regulation protein RsbU (phosphoserine phosphatase)